MNIVRNGKELAALKKKTIIYGGGYWGRILYGEVKAHVSEDLVVVCDENEDVCRKYKKYLRIDELKKYIRDGQDIVLAIAISDENIVREVYQGMIDMGCDSNDIYRYVPETQDEWEQRKAVEGFFNGKEQNFLMPDMEAKILMQTLIKGREPFLFSRWGGEEGYTVFYNKVDIFADYKDALAKGLSLNAGVFPLDEDVVRKYIEITEDAAKQIDILCMGLWCRQVEELYRWYSAEAKLVSDLILPVSYPKGKLCDKIAWGKYSWTFALQHMKVLVIHPFAQLIEKQYKRREKLFEDKEILPDFELKTYKAIQSHNGNKIYHNWVDALIKMEEDISKIDFDIALLGCGAYGMPLGAFIKNSLRKKAVHIGGSLQLLFGIKGHRWDDMGMGRYLYNEYWVRPTSDVRPENYESIENGCYW